MLLDDQHKAGNILNCLHAAAAEMDTEDFGTRYCFAGQIDDTTTFLVLAMSLYIEHAVEARFGDVNLHLDSIGQTADHHVGSWEIGTEVGVIAIQFWIACVASNALTLGTMIHRIAEGVDATRLGQARILTGLGLRIAESIICTLLVGRALGLLDRHTLTQRG